MSAETSTRRVCDRYELIERIGRGGMGSVWRALDTRLQRRVAIKEVDLPHELTNADRDAIQARTLREARAAARLSHPSAVTVFDVQQDDGRAYIIMELVDAPTLADVIHTGGPLTPAAAARLGIDVLGALEHAHAEGIVHRDVKPANIMMPPGDSAKLADFGIASLKNDPKITATGIVLGSPAFMAPEQAEGQPSGPPVDLWALGATLFYAVEGHPPFDRGHAIATLAAVTRDELPPMHNAGRLEPVIRALLQKDPARRPAASRARTMLEEVARGAAVVPTVGSAEPPITTVAGSGTAPPSVRHEERRRPRAAMWVAATLLLLGVIGLGAWLWATPEANDPGPREAKKQRGGSGADTGEAAGPGEAADEPGQATDEPGGAGTVPAGWTIYRSESTGFEVAYPAGWEVVEQSVDGDSVDFRDPGSSTYVRVDWKSPPGPSAVEAWEQFEPSFASEHAGYQRIGDIEATTFQGYEAATWEFTFEDGGATIHALDLGFIVGNDYGFALYFSALDEEWDEFQDEFQTFQDSFEAPPLS